MKVFFLDRLLDAIWAATRNTISRSSQAPLRKLPLLHGPLLPHHHDIPDPPPLRPHRLNLPIQPTVARLRPPGPDGAPGEQGLDLLDRLPRRLGVGEEGLGGGAAAEDAEDDEELPGDVLKGRGDEEADCEVEEPVGDGGEGHAGGTRLEGPDLGRIHPGDGRQRDGVDEDEQVAEGDDGGGGGARHLDLDAEVALEAVRERGPVGAEDAANDEHAGGHAEGAVDEEWPSARDVDEEEGGRGPDDEDGVLDPRRHEPDVARQVGHFEDVDHVVRHDVGAGELLPRLHGHAGKGALPHAVFEEPAPTLLASC